MLRALLALALGFYVGAADASPLQSRDSNYNKSITVAGGCSAGSFGIDPNAGANPAPSNASGTTTLTVTFSTTDCPDEIFIPVISNLSITGVASPHLTWTCRGCAVGSANIGNWVAQASTALTNETATITASGSTFISAGAIAFTGIHAAGPFDTNAAIPNSPGSACAWTTSNANDILFGSQQPSSGTTVVGTGWTTVAAQSSGFMGAAFKSVSATQTALAADGTAFAVTSSVEAACDALIQGP